MNFFEAQDNARKRTQWLLVYYGLAVIAVVISVYAIVAVAMLYLGETHVFWMPSIFTFTAIGTGGLIGTGSLFKSMQLSGGGSVVARDLGGRQIDSYTTDPEERRYVNIVEEMAIASGVPVPEIWIMDDEMGINAFAAGTEPGNAVVAVTRGCIQRLTRDELQGVIAHEFSHILNGDMRLNMRLMGMIFGILMISMIGKMLFEALRFMPMRSSRNDKNGGALGIVIVLFLAGLALVVVGSIGVFFARMIQAAISRQREFLADASAVQFTRNPDGIANALKKIGGMEYGSKLQTPKAEEASHLFFADGGLFSYGFATHPPLEVRIKAILGDWDGEFASSSLPNLAEGRSFNAGHGDEAFAYLDGRMNGLTGEGHQPPPLPSLLSVTNQRERIEDIGRDSQIDVQMGQLLRRGLKPEWLQACRDREMAQALVFGLLLAEDNHLKNEEVDFIKREIGPNGAEWAIYWNTELTGLHSSLKIALIDLAIPTLKRISPIEYDRFVTITQWLISSDGQVDLFEFMLQRIVQRHLDVRFRQVRPPKIQYRKIEELQHETNVLLSTLAALGGESQMDQAYHEATIDLRLPLEQLPPDACNLESIESALKRFEASTPLVKKQLLRACGQAVMSDGVIESREAELLRAIADSIGCPIPPFVREK